MAWTPDCVLTGVPLIAIVSIASGFGAWPTVRRTMATTQPTANPARAHMAITS